MKTWPLPLRIIGYVLCVPGLLLLALLFLAGQKSIDAAQVRLTANTRVTISWPAHWGCDEFDEAYVIQHIEPPNAVARWLFTGETLLKPYPAGYYLDTTDFTRYYTRLGLRREDTVIVRGHFGDDINVGDPGLTECEAIPYFAVDAIYTQRGRLLRRF